MWQSYITSRSGTSRAKQNIVDDIIERTPSPDIEWQSIAEGWEYAYRGDGNVLQMKHTESGLSLFLSKAFKRYYFDSAQTYLENIARSVALELPADKMSESLRKDLIALKQSLNSDSLKSNFTLKQEHNTIIISDIHIPAFKRQASPVLSLYSAIEKITGNVPEKVKSFLNIFSETLISVTHLTKKPLTSLVRDNYKEIEVDSSFIKL